MNRRKRVTCVVFLLILSSWLFIACSSSPLTSGDMANSNQEVAELLQNKLSVSTVDEAVSKAESALQNRNMDLAQLYYIKAYEMEPGNVVVLQKMADLYVGLKKYDLAEVSLKLILKQNPGDLKVTEQLGLLLIDERNYQNAKEYLNRVVSKQKSWRAYNGLGIIANLEGETLSAVIFFKKAESINPNSPELLNNIGFALYSAYKLDEAAVYYLKALQINPEFEKAIYNYGLLQARLRNYEEAYIAFAKVASAAEANNDVGYIAMKNGDYAMANRYLKEAISLSPRFYKKASDNLTQLEILEKQ